MEHVSSNKREREGSDGLPEEKRLRADIILRDIFEDESDAGEEEVVASVMKSLEEEICLPLPPPASTALSKALDEFPLFSDSQNQHDLGYLLEASDDELGLPPTMPVMPLDRGEYIEAISSEFDTGFGRIWGFADEMAGCYNELEFAEFRADLRGSASCEEATLFDGVLFDYSDVEYTPASFSDISWQSDSLPAV